MNADNILTLAKNSKILIDIIATTASLVTSSTWGPQWQEGTHRLTEGSKKKKLEQLSFVPL